jgi:hypothetical protein
MLIYLLRHKPLTAEKIRILVKYILFERIFERLLQY